VQGVIDLIGQRLPSIFHHKLLKLELFEISNESFNTNILSCPTHGPQFGKKFIEFTIKVIVHN